MEPTEASRLCVESGPDLLKGYYLRLMNYRLDSDMGLYQSDETGGFGGS
jgi:hypothetical protein